MTKNKVI